MGGMDGPPRELDASLQVAVCTGVELKVFDHKIRRSHRFARVTRDKLIGARKRRCQPRDNDGERHGHRDTPHGRRCAHSAASRERRSMIPR